MPGNSPVRAPSEAVYSRGRFEFRGRSFIVDSRTYLTDPELSHLVDAVVREARALALSLGRPPVLAEFGIGCGSLSICVKLEFPDAVVVGLDIDPGALEVARANIAGHHVEIDAVRSDGFEHWPRKEGPDMIFGDPPWGDHTTVYGSDRPIEHYLAMPAVSVFPQKGGPTGCHEQILREARDRKWPCHLVLNCGVLDEGSLGSVAALADQCAFEHPAPGVMLMRARMGNA